MHNFDGGIVSTSQSIKISITYYAFLSILASIGVQLLSAWVGMSELLPFFKSLFLGVLIAIPFGSYFGHKIIHLEPPYKLKAFGLGVLLFICALPFYDLGLLYLLQDTHPSLYAGGTDLKHLSILYCFIVIYSFIFSGLWLALLSGFAAIYLRDKIAPSFNTQS